MIRMSLVDRLEIRWWGASLFVRNYAPNGANRWRP